MVLDGRSRRKGDSVMNCPPLLYLILDFEKYCLCILGQLLTTIRHHKTDRRWPSSLFFINISAPLLLSYFHWLKYWQCRAKMWSFFFLPEMWWRHADECIAEAGQIHEHGYSSSYSSGPLRVNKDRETIVWQNDHINNHVFIESPVILLLFQLIFLNVTIDLAMWCRSGQLIPFFIRAKPPKFS